MSKTWTQSLSMLVSVLSKTILMGSLRVFQHREKHVLKEATVNGKKYAPHREHILFFKRSHYENIITKGFKALRTNLMKDCS